MIKSRHGSVSPQFVGRNGEPDELVIYEKWVTSGMTGGNCWGAEPRPLSSYEIQNEPDLSDLDDLLADICPSISMLLYKKLLKELVNYSDYGESTYYGNYTEGRYKWINVGELCNWLKAHDLLVADDAV